MADGRGGDPVALGVVDEREVLGVGDVQGARVLAADAGRDLQFVLHERAGGAFVADAALADVRFPCAPWFRRRRIIHLEDESVVAFDEDAGREPADRLLIGGFLQAAVHVDDVRATQVAAQLRTVRVPQSQGASLGAPVDDAAAHQARQRALHAHAQRVVERDLARPLVAAGVARGVEIHGQARCGTAAPLILIEEGLEDRAGRGAVERPFALVVAVRYQMAGVVVEDLGQEPADRGGAVDADGVGVVEVVALTADHQESRVRRLHIGAAVGDLDRDLQSLFEGAMQDVAAERMARVGHVQGAVVIMEEARLEADRLREQAERPAERLVGAQARVQALAQSHHHHCRTNDTAASPSEPPVV